MKTAWRSLLATAVVAVSTCAMAAEDPTEVKAVVEAVKAANPDIRALCQGGPDGIRKAVTDVIVPLVREGKVKGNPHAVGTEAGYEIGGQCRRA